MKIEQKDAAEIMQQKFKDNTCGRSSLPNLKNLAVMNNNMIGRVSLSSIGEGILHYKCPLRYP